MKDLKITKGEWEVNHDRTPNGISAIAEHIAIVSDEWDIACVFTDITEEGDEEKNNAILIADAGNTAQLCGLLPSELLKQRDELLEAAKGIAELLPLTPTQEEWTNACVKLESVITKIEEK